MGDDELDFGKLAQMAVEEVAGSVFPPLKGKLTGMATAWLKKSLCEWFDIPVGKEKGKEDVVLEKLDGIQNALTDISATLGELGRQVTDVAVALTKLEDQILQNRVEEVVREIEKCADSINLEWERYAGALHVLRTAKTGGERIDAMYSLRDVFRDAKRISEKMVHIRSAAWKTEIPMGRVLTDFFPLCTRQAVENYASDPSNFVPAVGSWPSQPNRYEGWPFDVFHYDRLLVHGVEIVQAELDEKILPTFRFILGTLLKGLALLEAASRASARFLTEAELNERKSELVEFAVCFKTFVDEMCSSGYRDLIAKALEKHAKRLTKSLIPASHIPHYVFKRDWAVGDTLKDWPIVGENAVMWSMASYEMAGLPPPFCPPYVAPTPEKLDQLSAMAGQKVRLEDLAISKTKHEFLHKQRFESDTYGSLVLVDSPWKFGKRKFYIVAHHITYDDMYQGGYPCVDLSVSEIDEIMKGGQPPPGRRLGGQSQKEVCFYFQESQVRADTKWPDEMEIEPRPLSHDKVAFLSSWKLPDLVHHLPLEGAA